MTGQREINWALGVDQERSRGRDPVFLLVRKGEGS